MFKNLLDNAPVAIVVNRLSDGEVLYANQKLADMIGLPLDQLIGEKTPDFYFDPSDREHVLEALRTKGKVENFELHVKRADGTPFWVEVSFELITFEGEPAFFGGSIDITQRKEVEGSIQSNKSRFEDFAKAASDYFWEIDEKLRFVYFSDRFEEVTGVAPEKLLGKTRQESGIPDVEQEAWQNHLADLAAHRPFRNFTHPRTRPDGKVVVLSISGVPAFDDNNKFKGYRGSGSDITERKSAEQAHLESEQHLRGVMGNAADAIVTIDESGRIDSLNSATESMFGYSHDELIGQDVAILMTSEDRPRHDDYVRNFLDTGKAKIIGIGPREVTGRRKDGSTFSVELAVGEMQLSERRMFVGSLRDITERKEAEAALRENEKRYRSLYNNTPVMMHSIGKDGRLISVSDYWLQVLGYERDEVVGRSPTDFLTEESRRFALDEVLPKLFATGEAKDVQYQFVKKDGEVIDVLLSAIAEHDADGGIIRSLAVLNDITEHKRAEDALRLTQFALDSAGDVVFWLGKNGEFKYVNKFGQRMLGYSWDELSAMHIWDVDPDVAQADWTRIWARISSREPHTFDAVHVTKDGGHVPVEVTTAHVSFDGRPIICAFSRDITERKQAEEALRDSEAKLNAFFENAPVGLGTFDNQLRYTKINEALARLNGVPAEEHIGRTIADVIPALASVVETQYREILESGKPQLNTEFNAEFPGMEGDEQYRLLSRFPIPGHDGKPVGVGAVALDITERKLAEKAAKESEEKYRSLVELSPDAVFVQQDGIIVFANSSAVGLYRADGPEQLVGRESTSLVHSEDRHLLLDRRDVLEHSETMQDFGALRRLRLDGSTFFGESAVSFIPWRGAQATLIVIRDNTERQAIEDQLRQAQKMEAVGQLTGGVAHDFNNLLTVVLGNLELLRDDTSEHETHHRLVESAIRATVRGAMLTKSLLAFSRKQTLQPKELDLNELVNDMLDMLHRTLGENIAIEAKTADNLWSALADPAQVESALLNLVLNSRDALPNGGRLTIEAANVKIDDEYEAHDTDVGPGEYVILSVSDTGIGMNQEAMRHAFEPFFTTKEVGEGSGLGLSMVHGFVKQSGGHVTIHSEENRGTTVELYLPRATHEAHQVKLDVAKAEPKAENETILVVEDDPDVRTLAVALLGDLGYEVLEAGDGASAIAAMKSRSRIDLLFTDVILAGSMSGPEIAEEAKRLHPAIRILFMSGYPREAMVSRGQLGKSADMLNKPFHKADLAEKIRGALCQAAPATSDSSA